MKLLPGTHQQKEGPCDSNIKLNMFIVIWIKMILKPGSTILK